MAKEDCKMIYKVDGFDPLILTETNEQNIKSILFELHQSYTIIRCIGPKGEDWGSLSLTDLYGEK